MSIHVLIEDCLASGRLFRLHPWLPSTKPIRLIYISRPVKEFIDSDVQRAGQLHADLDSFIGGDTINVSMTPRKARSAYMGRLDPTTDGIWDIRSRDPSPSLRLLGGFAKKDEFVALVLYERLPLGAYGSRAWSIATTDCNVQWGNRFHAYRPLTGDDPNGYLSKCSCMD